MSDINLKGCAVLDLSEYERLKSLERNDLTSTLKYMIERLTDKGSGKITYKGLTLTISDNGFNLHIPDEKVLK